MNDIKIIVACNEDGSINPYGIFAYKSLFTEAEFVEDIRECLGIMPKPMYDNVMNVAMLVCKDVSSSTDNKMLVSMVKAMEGRNVGRVCVFADANLFELFRKSGNLQSYICVYPKDTKDKQNLNTSYNVLQCDEYDTLVVEQRVCSASWSENDVTSAIDDIEKMLNTENGIESEHSETDEITEQLRNDAQFEDFIQHLESQKSDDESIELSSDDIVSIAENDSECHIVQAQFASIEVVQKMATLLNQTVGAVNKNSEQLSVVIGLLNRHMEKDNEMFEMVSKSMESTETRLANRIDINESSVENVRHQLSLALKEITWVKIIPTVASVIAIALSIYGLV